MQQNDVIFIIGSVVCAHENCQRNSLRDGSGFAQNLDIVLGN
jgi:hypothetical protein